MTIDLHDFARNLERMQREARHARRSGSWTPSMTPASGVGYRCERRLAYQQVRSDMSATIGQGLASIFEEGKFHESQIRRELSELGYEVLEAEHYTRDDRSGLSGKIDGKIQVDPDDRHRLVPVEIKSTAGRGPSTEEEWRDTESELLRRYYCQLQIYMYFEECPEGLGLFKNKNDGLWTICPATLDYELCEELLSRAERVRDHVKLYRDGGGEESLPERLPNRSECYACPFKDTICLPSDADVDGMAMTNDAELLKQCEERERCDPDRKIFAKADKAIKDRIKLTKGDRFIVGTDQAFLITRTIGKTGSHLIKIKRLLEEQGEDKES